MCATIHSEWYIGMTRWKHTYLYVLGWEHERSLLVKRNGISITAPFILTPTKVNEAAESSRFYQIIPPGLSGLRSMQQRWEMATVVWDTADGVSQPRGAMDTVTRTHGRCSNGGSYQRSY